MSKSLKIESADISQAEEILALQKAAFFSEAVIHQNFSIPPLIQSLESLQNDFVEYDFYVATLEERIIGALKVKTKKNKTLSIGRLVIHPDFQNQGFGKMLMQFVEKKYKDIFAFELFTAEKSLRNVNFYQNLGYKIVRKFTEEAHEDIVLVQMAKTQIR